MRLSPRRRTKRTLVAGIMLAGFAVRALIPPGYMPGGERPFSIEICWEGLPPSVLAYIRQAQSGSMPASRHGPLEGVHHHSGSPSPSDHCVFGSACSAGPISHLPQANAISPARKLRAIEFASIAESIRLVHLPQPRAPPAQLS